MNIGLHVDNVKAARESTRRVPLGHAPGQKEIVDERQVVLLGISLAVHSCPAIEVKMSLSFVTLC